MSTTPPPEHVLTMLRDVTRRGRARFEARKAVDPQMGLELLQVGELVLRWMEGGPAPERSESEG